VRDAIRASSWASARSVAVTVVCAGSCCVRALFGRVVAEFPLGFGARGADEVTDRVVAVVSASPFTAAFEALLGAGGRAGRGTGCSATGVARLGGGIGAGGVAVGDGGGRTTGGAGRVIGDVRGAA
jgi:hypothetical protein